jgi:hypothetical protein
MAIQSANQRTFIQGIAQLDFDLNGNKIVVDSAYDSTDGRLQDQSLAFLSLSVGSWLHRDQAAPNVTGLLALLEAHYTRTLNDADVVGSNSWSTPVFTSRDGGLNCMNLTFALHFEMRSLDVRTGVVVPVGEDKPFDCEFGVQVNYWFGRGCCCRM